MASTAQSKTSKGPKQENTKVGRSLDARLRSRFEELGFQVHAPAEKQHAFQAHDPANGPEWLKPDFICVHPTRLERQLSIVLRPDEPNEVVLTQIKLKYLRRHKSLSPKFRFETWIVSRTGLQLQSIHLGDNALLRIVGAARLFDVNDPTMAALFEDRLAFPEASIDVGDISKSAPSKEEYSHSTTIASVRANASSILASLAVIELLIEEGINTLQNERPNTRTRSVQRAQEVAELTVLQSQLKGIKAAVVEILSGKPDERKLSHRTSSFSRGVQAYWDNHHEKICDSVLQMTMFAGFAGVCHAIGAPSTITVTLSAALAGGKDAVAAIKGLSKL